MYNRKIIHKATCATGLHSGTLGLPIDKKVETFLHLILSLLFDDLPVLNLVYDY